MDKQKKWLAKTELEISEISEFLILALYWNQKLGKIGNTYNTCKFQGKCFTWGTWKIPRFLSFRFWPLYWNRKLRKLGNIYNTCKFKGMSFTWGSLKFPRFPSFQFWPLYWNRKLGKLGNIYNTCKFQGMCFTWQTRSFSAVFSADLFFLNFFFPVSAVVSMNYYMCYFDISAFWLVLMC